MGSFGSNVFSTFFRSAVPPFMLKPGAVTGCRRTSSRVTYFRKICLIVPLITLSNPLLELLEQRVHYYHPFKIFIIKAIPTNGYPCLSMFPDK
jgi:hypothetical protein